MAESAPDNLIRLERYFSAGQSVGRVVRAYAVPYNPESEFYDQSQPDMGEAVVSSGSESGAHPTYADFMTMQQETRDLFERGQRENREQIERSSRELRETAREDRSEILTAIAESNAALRADMNRDFARVETRIESLAKKTDENDRQILEAQTTVKVLLVVITVIGAVVSIVAGIAQFA